MKLALFTALAAAALSLTPVRSLFQAPPKDKPAESGQAATPRPVRWGTEEEAQRIRDGLQGAWRLVSARLYDASYEGEMCEGIMLVAPEHLSMQFRVLAPTGALRDTYFEGFSAGTYRWRYDLARLKVVIHTAMAVNNLGGDNDWEPPGTQREYDVLLTDDQLTFTRPGEAQFTYSRLRPAPAPKPKTSR